MSFKRNRTTWGQASRKASAPPAVPGYGKEDQDHPAHSQDDPGVHQYENGDTSSWNEDVRRPPYPEGNPPAVPGYDSEDQDHPAHKRNPRVPKDAALSAQITSKAAKCLVLARHQLGKAASQDKVESQALDMMDLPDKFIESSLKRLGGGFMAMDDDMFLGGFDDDDDMFDDDMGMMDDDLGVMDIDDGMYADDFEGPGDDVMGMLQHMAAELRSLKAQLKGADQNDPPAESEEEEKEERDEADAPGKGEPKSGSRKFASLKNRIATYFAQHGGGEDGFVLGADWTGSKALFAALDTDRDGIVACDEMMGSMFDPSEDLLAMAEDFTEGEVGMLNACGEMVLAGEVPEAFKKNWKKDDDKDDDDKDEKPWEKDKKAGKKSMEDEDEGEDEGEGEGEDEGEGEGEGEDEGEDGKTASLFDVSGHDPMGLSKGQGIHLSAADEALLDEIFSSGLPGHQASEDLDLLPQPRRASTGVTSLGHQTRTASSRVDNLSDLWKSAPNVNKAFGIED